ncbi:tripartite tricarboxylate transporter TctB family protein [Nocardioides insulae]|uniref:tripartite tricarboxylate transporter TctB family protein n=1 Tax=Nocardioides insulae TaxID=394734 RepID=UPI00146DEAC7|nr:tripartite tricarboxylate transporter TctB family protein [Nocardioides insulae]
MVAALVTCLGVAAILGSRTLGYWVELGPGPGFFPLWLGVALTLLGGIWLVMEVRAWRSPSGTDVAEVSAEEATPEYDLSTVIAILGSLCVLAACLEPIGYQLSMLVFLLYHLMVLGRRGPVLSIVIALCGSFGVFTIFTRFLTVPLPTSSIPFLRDLGL